MTGLTLPLRLQPGDRVALLAPASPGTPERWRGGRRALESLGFRVQMGQQLICPDGYSAGSPEQRAQALNRAFCDPAIQGIWCLRGGYTAARLLPLLDYEAIGRSPKVFVGYSDITCLHAALNQRSGFATYHGPMAASDLAEQPRPETVACLLETLAGAGRFVNPTGRPLTCLRPGRAEGQLTGGNLTVLASLLGTPWAPEPEGKILFLEEVSEPVPALARLLGQLADAGWFRRCAGVLLGSFSHCENRFRREYGPEALFRDFFQDASVPVLAGLACGHCAPTGTLPLGKLCRIDAGAGTIAWL